MSEKIKDLRVQRRYYPILGVVLLVALICACAFTISVLAASGTITIKLPRVYVNFVYNDAEQVWRPRIWGFDTARVERLTKADLSMLEVPDYWMEQFMAANIQHIEIAVGEHGVLPFVNGMPLPYLFWNAEMLALAGEKAVDFGVPPAIGELLPILQKLNLDVMFVIPRKPGTEDMPFRPQEELRLSTAKAEIDTPETQLIIPLGVDEEGTFRLFGVVSTVQMDDLIEHFTGFRLNINRLDPAVVDMIQQAGIDRLALQVRGNGMFVTVNDQDLIAFAWGPEHLSTISTLYNQVVVDPDYQTMVKELVDKFNFTEVDISLSFPP